MKKELDDALEHLLRMLNARVPPPLPEHLAANPKFISLCNQIQDLRDISVNFALGNIEYQIQSKGFVMGGLKNLQANLRHLTWQVLQVKNQDFSQQVSFMGDFSEAFNSMVAQLAAAMDDLASSRAKFKTMASVDALTGAYTRLYFMSDAKQSLRDAAESKNPFSLVMMDIDKFKELNDTHGHQCGDAALRHVVHLMQGALRKNDRVYRYGGEEFAVLLMETPPERAAEITELMRTSIENTPLPWENQQIPITASFGVCYIDSIPKGEDAVSHIIEIADKCLYQAKNSGRNKVVCGMLSITTNNREVA